MDIHDIKEIKTTSKESEANKYLAEGYVLLSVAAGKDEADYPLTIYSLGKPVESSYTLDNL